MKLVKVKDVMDKLKAAGKSLSDENVRAILVAEYNFEKGKKVHRVTDDGVTYWAQSGKGEA